MPEFRDVFQIDPEGVRIDVDVDFIAHLEELTMRALEAVVFEGKYVVIHHETVVDELVDPFTQEYSTEVSEKLHYRDFEPEFFVNGHFQCPRDADLEWQEQQEALTGKASPRPWPSIMVYPGPTGAPEAVVANPSLCDGCMHRLRRAQVGQCYGLRYEPISRGLILPPGAGAGIVP